MLLFIDNARHANILRHRKDRNEKLFSCMHFFFYYLLDKQKP